MSPSVAFSCLKQIKGKENLPSNDVPAVYVANHCSYLVGGEALPASAFPGVPGGRAGRSRGGASINCLNLPSFHPERLFR